MKAVVYTEYGPPDVLQLTEVEKPTPKDDEVLVEVRAAAVNYADWSFVRGKPFLVRLIGAGLLKPKNRILGADIAGRVEAVGTRAKQFQPGDEVFGDLADIGFGGLAEYVSVPESALALKPVNLTYEEAAAVPQAAVVALQGLRDEGCIQPGQKVLINGASGGIGTFGVQIAKSFGAEVTGVCSTRNLDLVRSIGADQVVDCTQEDLTEKGEVYDVIFDVVGKVSFSHSEGSIKEDGTYLLANPTSQMVQALWTRMRSGKKVIMETASGTLADLAFLREPIEAGKIRTAIDCTYPLEDIVKAHRYVEKGGKKGNVVITVEHSDKTR